MVLKLYGFPISTCTKRVVVTLKEHNVPYELIVIDITKGVQKDPSYKEIQPFGQIPYIVRVYNPSFLFGPFQPYHLQYRLIPLVFPFSVLRLILTLICVYNFH